MVFGVLSSVVVCLVDFFAIVFVILSAFCIGFVLFMWWGDAGCSKVFASEVASESLRRNPPDPSDDPDGHAGLHAQKPYAKASHSE